MTSGFNVASFSSIQLSDGQSATFSLNGSLTNTPPTGTNSFGRRQLSNLKLASMFSSGPPAGGASMLLMGLLMPASSAEEAVRAWEMTKEECQRIGRNPAELEFNCSSDKSTWFGDGAPYRSRRAACAISV